MFDTNNIDSYSAVVDSGEQISKVNGFGSNYNQRKKTNVKTRCILNVLIKKQVTAQIVNCMRQRMYYLKNLRTLILVDEKFYEEIN